MFALFVKMEITLLISSQVAGIVDNLKMMAMDMGTELDKQNTQIERITDKVLLKFYYSLKSQKAVVCFSPPTIYSMNGCQSLT